MSDLSYQERCHNELNVMLYLHHTTALFNFLGRIAVGLLRMQSIPTDGVAWNVGLSVGLSRS